MATTTAATEEDEQQDLCSHLVVPGQVIAVSSSNEDSFLRGHGTYLESTVAGKSQLRASVTGTVQRVNKLLSVEAVSLYDYGAQVGDLVVGRVQSIGNARWNIDLGSGMTAALPLSGVHLPGSIQRVRTAADALEMRCHLQEGDLVSAEVHKTLSNNQSVMLHTRSVRYGKLENGVVVTVPAKLVRRSKTHYTTICNGEFQILLGCSGMIWMQRNNSEDGDNTLNSPAGGQHELAEAHEKRRKEHADTSYTVDERRNLARLRSAVLILRQTLSEITPQAIEDVYDKSKDVKVAEMLLPENVVALTAGRRPV